MNEDEQVEERLRRTFAQVGASTTITERSVPPSGLDELTDRAALSHSRLVKTVVASFVSVVVVVSGVLWITRSTTHQVNVIGTSSNSQPSTSTTPSSTLSCPQSGVAPDGHTYGTQPGPLSTAPAPEFVAVGSSQDFVHPPKTRDDSRRILGYQKLGAGLPTPVYACDLTTIVGHIYEHKGFLPVGVNPETVPTFPYPVTINALGLVVENNVALVEMVWAESGSSLAASLSGVGLGIGDTITSVDGTPITSGTSLNAATAAIQYGAQVQVSWTDPAGLNHSATVQT